MSIQLNPQDRFIFHSAVAAQDIQFILNDLNSQLFYDTPHSLSTDILGSHLLNPIPMGNGNPYTLPYSTIEFDTSLLLDPTIKVQAESLLDGFRIFFLHSDGFFTNCTLFLEFDSYMTLRHFGISFGPMAQSHPHERRMVMNAAFIDLPTILGYIVDTNSRNRIPFTLGEPRQYNVLDNHDSQPVQNLGDIRQITNPRDNPTGITKRPHERAGHTRQLADGRIIDVSPTTVHRDDFEGEDRPKIIKH